MNYLFANLLAAWLYSICAKPPINAHADLSSKKRNLNFGPRLYLHPNLMHASSKGSGELGHMQRLAVAFLV